MRAALWAVCLAGWLAGCAAAPVDRLAASHPGLPAQVPPLTVPFVGQLENQCGPAALSMVLAWGGDPVDATALAEQVFTPGRQGSFAPDMVSAARRRGRLAVPITGLDALLAELAAGHPVVVLQNLGLEMVPRWHFAVAVGYDLNQRVMVEHSGLDQYRSLSLDRFAHVWERGGYWGLVVLPPDRLPVTASEADVLRAAAALERAGRPAEADLAYGAILARWPASLAALMGQGNARYSLGRWAAAADAYQQAASLDAAAPAPWNNLAHALARQGDHAAALAAARKAVSLGGDRPPWRDTVQEVAGGQ